MCDPGRGFVSSGAMDVSDGARPSAEPRERRMAPAADE